MSNFLIDEDTDLLAAEFVLGTLDSEERANAQAQLRTDHGFIAMVRIWERRFGELHLMVEPVDPDAKVFERIKAKVAEIAPAQPVPDGKPAPEASPQPADATTAPATLDAAKPAETPETSANAEAPKPADASAPVAVAVPPDGIAPTTQDAPASETAPSG
jgi:outer membrane biosynthesis protein TonB